MKDSVPLRGSLFLSVAFMLMLLLPLTASATNVVTHKLHFDQPKLANINILGNNFTKVIMPGTFTKSDGLGEPVMQVVPVRLLLPQGTDVDNIEVKAENTLEINASAMGYDLASAEPILPSQAPVPFGSPAPTTLAKNEAVYNSSEPVPNKMYSTPGIQYSHGYAILTINVFPTRYIPKEGRLFYYPDIDIKVNLKNTGEINRFYRPGNQSDRQWVQSLVDNPDIANTYGNTPSPLDAYPGGLCDPNDNGGLGYDYVIITRSSLYNFTAPYTWDSLIARKEAQGLEATKVKVEDILASTDYENPDPLFDDEAARIREFMKDAYLDWGAQYILVGGDQDGVAAIHRRLMDYEYEYGNESDLYWSNLDNTFNADHDSYWGEAGDGGFDLYSELWIGSIPCDVGQDVSNWLKKSFYYADNVDQDYLNNGGFYGGDTGWPSEGDEFIDYSAIKGLDDFLGPDPHYDWPYPEWLGFQYGFETWNSENPGLEFDMNEKWTAEPTNPGWHGGSDNAAINGMRNAINNDDVTLISAIAHANEYMSMDVYSSDWENPSLYHNTKPFFLTDYGCHCGDMDAADDGVLHSMLFNSDTYLAFATVYNTSYGWGSYYSTGSSSAVQQKSFWDYLFNTDNCGGTINWELGKAQAWSKDLISAALDWGPADDTWRGVIESCLLFGDPAQLLKPPAMPDHNVGVQSVDAPSHVAEGDPVDVLANVFNNGQNDESGVVVRLVVNDVVLDSTIIPLFESQDVRQVNFSYTPPSIGLYNTKVDIYIPGVDEFTYDDNEKTTLVIVGPDVAITSIDAPDYARIGEAVDISGTVSNPGPTDEYIKASLKFNGATIDSQFTYLASGANTTITFSWNPSQVGTFPIGVEASISEEEPYTDNNYMGQDVEIFVARGYILLVDDDEGGSYETYFENALLASSYIYDVWDHSSQGTPPVSTMQDYDAVIWFTGDDYWYTLDSSDETNLANYLDNGGSLFITGQDIGYDIGGTSFYTNYLHANYQVDNTGIMTLNGVSGDPIGDGLTIGISGGDGANNQNWPDGISPVGGATTVFEYQNSSYDGGIRFDNGTYRLVYFGFGYEAINSADDRNEVMSRTLNWLLGGLPLSIAMVPDEEPVIVAPGESFTFTGILINNTNDPQTTDVWIMLNVPNYGMYGPVNQYNDIPLSGGESLVYTGISQYVPTYAPTGEYEYIAYCGDYPNDVIDMASFGFTVATGKSELQSVSIKPSELNETPELTPEQKAAFLKSWKASRNDIRTASIAPKNTVMTNEIAPSAVSNTIKAPKVSTITLPGTPADWVLTGWFDVDALLAKFGDGVTEQLPTEFSLSQNYPNPFNPTTTIKYALPQDSYVSLEVYNLRGQKVTTLVNGKEDAGYKIVQWDASNYASGIYFYKLTAGERVFTKRMTLLK